jgi:N-acetylmuramoyl-L-alanine amidase
MQRAFNWTRLAAATALALAAGVLAGCTTLVPRTMAPGSFQTVVIDAGHGGKDSGERSRSGLQEKIFTLDTAKRLQPILQDAGFKTVMTRSDDRFVELNDRVAIANSYPDSILVSIHYNASPSSAPRGIETYFWQPGSYGLAIRVQRQLITATALPNRGVLRRVLRLTHDPHVPSILCECGFLTNHEDAALANTPEYRQRVAEGLADGILDQQEHGDVGVGALPPLVVNHPARHHRRHRHLKVIHHAASKKRHAAHHKRRAHSDN